MKTRTIYGVLYVLLVIVGVYFSEYVYFLLLAALGATCLWELGEIFGTNKKSVGLSLVVLLVGILTVFYDIQEHSEFVWAVYSFGVVVLMSRLVSVSKEKFFAESTRVTLSLLWIILPFILAAKIPYLSSVYTYEMEYILIIFVVLWANDSMAYVTGKYFGKNKLAPIVSPNKTIEGMIGGMIGAIIAGVIFNSFYPNFSVIDSIFLSLGISIFGTYGDLFESRIKRQFDLKDSGKLIPGHGGILDRLDSFLYAVIFAFVFYTFVL